MSILDRLLKDMENYIPPEPKKMSVEFQLGVMIGEYIVYKYLPTINVECQSNHTINVSDDEEKEYNRLQEEWRKDYNAKNKPVQKWIDYRTYAHMLEKKYLPHVLECYVNKIDVENITELKDGIRLALWDCDICSYKIENDEDIIIEEQKYPFDYQTLIKLNLDIDREIIC
jgi:hypothetical protein